MVEDRWVHAARSLTSIEFSFDPCNIYRDGPRGVGYTQLTHVQLAIAILLVLRFYVFTFFFRIQKRDFYVFCFVAYVLSNTALCFMQKAVEAVMMMAVRRIGLEEVVEAVVVAEADEAVEAVVTKIVPTNAKRFPVDFDQLEDNSLKLNASRNIRCSLSVKRYA